jgi:hypothetical protein
MFPLKAMMTELEMYRVEDSCNVFLKKMTRKTRWIHWTGSLVKLSDLTTKEMCQLTAMMFMKLEMCRLEISCNLFAEKDDRVNSSCVHRRDSLIKLSDLPCHTGQLPQEIAVA